MPSEAGTKRRRLRSLIRSGGGAVVALTCLCPSPTTPADEPPPGAGEAPASVPAGGDRLHETAALFKKYGAQYGLDWLLLAAQAYQESRLDQTLRSRAGAVGVMQILPETAAALGIPDIEELEANIHAGTKYLRLLLDHYSADPELDSIARQLFALAAYNAGPARIDRLRRDAARVGLDPNRWFGSVELVVAEQLGPEPVRHVSNVTKYYLGYQQQVRSGHLR